MSRGFLMGRVMLAFLVTAIMMAACDDDFLVRRDRPEQRDLGSAVLSLELP
jgi:hypothetical protein